MALFLYITIAVLLGLVLYFAFRKQTSGLSNELKEIRKELTESREKNIESLQKQLEESGRIVRDVTGHIKDVTSQLEKVHADHQHVKDVKEQLGKLTDVLANPKQRGILGESFLETLLKKDLKNRIEETAKYIRPSEGTMEFAFMFIPSEGIYYDLLINQVGAVKISTYDLIEYAFKEK